MCRIAKIKRSPKHRSTARKGETVEPQKAIVDSLLAWFSQSARDLPWRRTRDPYGIWVSEIMLQQTQVKTVIPYWERWMQTLPTIQAVAEADAAVIHKLWEGLGYYTRVRNLQAAARQIVTEHEGQFPRDFAAILNLPGIGRYTAGAVASIAFNEPKPILDGNVMRVLTRVFGIADDPREKSTNAKLWILAEQLVGAAASKTNPDETSGGSGPSQLNQSLMELGALSCTPKQPKCNACPITSQCVAFREGTTGEIPNLAARVAATKRSFAAFVLEDQGRFLVRQRPDGLVNAHLWEFPNVEFTALGNGAAPSVPALARKFFGEIPDSLVPLCMIKHSITRYRITVHVFRGILSSANRVADPPGQWIALEELQKLAFPSAHRKILEML